MKRAEGLVKVLRAVELSKDQIIEFLNENFINAWVPNSELGTNTEFARTDYERRREREGKTFDTTSRLGTSDYERLEKRLTGRLFGYLARV